MTTSATGKPLGTSSSPGTHHTPAPTRVSPLRAVLLVGVALLLGAGSAALLVFAASLPLTASAGAAALDDLLGHLAAGAAGLVGGWWTLGLLACLAVTLRRVSPSSAVARLAGSLPRPLQLAAGATLGVALTTGTVPAALAQPGTTTTAAQLVASAEPEWLSTSAEAPDSVRTSPAAVEGAPSHASDGAPSRISPAAVEGPVRGSLPSSVPVAISRTTETGHAAATSVTDASAALDPAWSPLRPSTRPRVAAAPDALLPALRAETTTLDSVAVHRGDSLWTIAERYLGEGATDAEIAVEWPRWYGANRDVIGDDPDHIEPGQLLVPPGATDYAGT